MTTISTGAEFKDAQVENNLFQMAMAYPSVSDKIVRQYTQFSTQFITNALTSVKELPLASNSHRWPIKGRYQDPLTASGTAPSNLGTSNSTFTFEFTTNQATLYDVVKFRSGVEAAILDGGVKTSGGYTYTMGISGPASQALVAADYAAGQNVGRGWTSFKEDSERGFGAYKFADWNINYTSISRRASSVTGSALATKVWATDSRGGKVGWYYDKHMEDLQNFLYEREKKLKYSTSNFNSAGLCLRPDLNGDMLPQGDGQVAQIAGINTDSYTGDLTYTQLQDFIFTFKRMASLKAGDSVTVEMGTEGEHQWYNCMEAKYLIQSPILRQDIKGGTSVTLGNVYPTFYYAGLYFHIVVNPVMDDPQFFVNLDTNGAPKESSTFHFYAVKQADGTPNIERYTRQLDDVDRGNIMKEVGGMMSKAGIVGSGRDAKVYEFLSDELVIIPNPLRCGSLLKA